MTSIGNTLRRERLNQGRSLGEIAEQTKINSRYLEAIEADRLEGLPGTFFYKSFVRQYAVALGLPPDHYAGLVDEMVGPPPEIEFTPENFPIKPLDPIVRDTNRRSFSDARIGWSVAALIAVALGCSGLYAWWHKEQLERNQHPKVAATEPAKPVQPPPSTKQEPKGASVTPAVPERASTAAPTGVSPSPSELPLAPDGGWQLNVSATEKTWLSVVSDGKRLFSGVLEPSETKTLQGKESARLLVGNAGGIEVHWNGRPIGPLGSRGQVCTVVFTRNNYQILPAGHEM
jgi:cytoskeletal protein RodZ